MKSKKGEALGSSILMMYRIFIIIVVSVVVLGLSSLVYPHHINTRDSEAMLLTREISDCVISESVVDVTALRLEQSVFEYCGFNDDEMESFFVSVVVKADGVDDFRIDGGDSGLLWIKDVFSGSADTEAIERYKPGRFKDVYDVLVLDGSAQEKAGKLSVEVVVNAE